MAIIKKQKRVKKGASRNKPPQPFVIRISLKYIVAVALLLFLGVLTYFAVVKVSQHSWGWHSDVVQIDSIIVNSRFDYIDKKAVKSAVLPFMKDDFYSVNLLDIKAKLLGLPWVSSVQVRRRWPDKIQVTIVEQGIIARWGESGLLNQAGEVFAPKDLKPNIQLPVLLGPDGSEHQVMDLYLELSLMLGGISPSITRLTVDQSYHWSVELNNGIRLILGDQDMTERVTRLVAIYPQVEVNSDRIKYIDLRYSSGLAIGWKNGILDDVNG